MAEAVVKTKNNKMLLYVGVAVAVLVVLAIVIAPMLKEAQKQKEDKDTTNEILENSQTISQGGQPTFVAKPYTDKIWDDTQSYFPTPSVYKEINDIADEDGLRAIWQDWHNRYKSQYKNRELRAALNAAYWSHQSWDPDWTGGAKLIADRLKAIGLP